MLNELFETLQKGFFKNIEKYKLFDNTEQLTYLSKTSCDGERKFIDATIDTYIDNLKEAHDITFDYVNTLVFSVAVTIKEHLKYVKYTKVRKKWPTKPKWIQNLDNEIKWLRKDISHAQLILPCSINNS